ncbi:unnamed protein product [Blepharisma stoltei]|uniref:Uncharacterized protein n=1 Tax=Blepharisma stoltei TaxID=1481888 RepID=A0AAU9I6P6_9CILI|nr:unnamed protein product [Blepharisma stoltei]
MEKHKDLFGFEFPKKFWNTEFYKTTSPLKELLSSGKGRRRNRMLISNKIENLKEIKSILEETIKENSNSMHKPRWNSENEEIKKIKNESMKRSISSENNKKKKTFLLISNHSVSPHTYLPSPIKFPAPRKNFFAKRYSKIPNVNKKENCLNLQIINSKPTAIKSMFFKQREASNLDEDKEINKDLSSGNLFRDIDLRDFKRITFDSDDSCSNESYGNFEMTPKLMKRHFN